MQAVTRRLYEMALQQKEEAERKTRELNQARQELSQMQKEQILTVERNRIARELHDNVAQILTSIGLNVEWCRQQVPGNSSLHQRLLWLKQLARNGIYEVRNAIFELSGVTILESGLVQALGNIAAEFERITGIEAGYSVEGTVRRLPTEAETALYRVAQEALYNIFKHAGANHVQLQIAFSQGEVSMEVTDDGVGIAETAIQRCRQGLTFGLKSMQGRMEDLGGTLEILNLDTDGRGTRIIARISDQEVKDGSHPSSLG
jgi:signal transduction histidine kinase